LGERIQPTVLFAVHKKIQAGGCQYQHQADRDFLYPMLRLFLLRPSLLPLSPLLRH
jgi:hypothetical protein